jgi:hypothetical protein
MRFTNEEALARQPVWAAMSELYLDNDDRPFDYVASVCAESAFSVDELEKILFEEVHPVLVANLSPAGLVWDSFDQSWLRERIQAGRPSFVIGNSPLQRWLRRWVWPWRHLRKRVVEVRASLLKSSSHAP